MSFPDTLLLTLLIRHSPGTRLEAWSWSCLSPSFFSLCTPIRCSVMSCIHWVSEFILLFHFSKLLLYIIYYPFIRVEKPWSKRLRKLFSWIRGQVTLTAKYQHRDLNSDCLTPESHFLTLVLCSTVIRILKAPPNVAPDSLQTYFLLRFVYPVFWSNWA